MWIQTGATVRKRLSWDVTSVTLTFDLWPWPFAWTSRLPLVITLKISWWYDDGNIVKKVWRTDRQTDGRTDWTIHRAAWSQLKIWFDRNNFSHWTQTFQTSWSGDILYDPATVDDWHDFDLFKLYYSFNGSTWWIHLRPSGLLYWPWDHRMIARAPYTRGIILRICLVHDVEWRHTSVATQTSNSTVCAKHCTGKI